MAVQGRSLPVAAQHPELPLFARNQSYRPGFSIIKSERLLLRGDLNWSMQRLNSNYRAEDVAHEAETEDLLQRRTEEPDVGSLAERRFHVRHSSSF